MYEDGNATEFIMKNIDGIEYLVDTYHKNDWRYIRD
jgi:hypothetical protein